MFILILKWKLYISAPGNSVGKSPSTALLLITPRPWLRGLKYFSSRPVVLGQEREELEIPQTELKAGTRTQIHLRYFHQGTLQRAELLVSGIRSKKTSLQGTQGRTRSSLEISQPDTLPYD